MNCFHKLKSRGCAESLIVGLAFGVLLGAEAAEVRHQRLMLGTNQVQGVVTKGKLVADEVIAADSNSLTMLHVEVTPLTNSTAASNSASAAGPASEPRLRLLLSTGEGSGQYGGVKGLHGVIYLAQDWKKPNLPPTTPVDIFASQDGTKVVVFVLDNGPLYSSTNSGMSWSMISTPSTYRVPLTLAADGAGFFASATIEASAGGLANTNPPNPNWFAVARAPDGSQMVLNRDVANPAPILSIVRTGEGAVVSWPAAAGDFVLQENTRLSATNWVDVTNAVNQMGERNQVLISPSPEHNFFRLRPR
jgi:hypothetical protein